MTVDIRHRVEIPGGIDIDAQLAGPAPRFFAFAIDLAIRGALLLVLGLLFAFSTIFVGGVGIGIWLLIAFLLEWFYPVLFELIWKGQTPGKRALGIAVVHDDLTPLVFGTSLVRNLLRAADFLPALYLFGLIAMVSNPRFQRLGDMAAGTFVISVRDLPQPARPRADEPLAPPLILDRNDQTAIINFLHRSDTLSQQRQRELASILSELTQSDDSQGVERLRRFGAWYMGA